MPAYRSKELASPQEKKMATKENQKKGSLFLSFYKSSIKSHKPKSQPAAAATLVSQKQSQNCQEIKQNNLVLKKVEGCQEIEAAVAQSNNYVEARKSVSHVETNLGTNMESVISFLQVKVLVSDMPGFMQVHAFRCARRTYDSLEKFSSKHIAYNIKKEFDKVYGPTWHCIVGSNFGSYVTHSTGCFLYFSMEKLYILVFKTKVQKAQNSN